MDNRESETEENLTRIGHAKHRMDARRKVSCLTIRATRNNAKCMEIKIITFPIEARHCI